MWALDYQKRLMQWADLRSHCQSLSLDQSLLAIDQWWRQAPWRAYYLHWDDRDSWPDPWTLLADNIYCDVARGLGMLYTVAMLDRLDCAHSQLVHSDRGNLVLVQDGKYVLNWTDGEIVNIRPEELTIHTVLEPAVLDRLIG